jgi:hypothetical protein
MRPSAIDEHLNVSCAEKAKKKERNMTADIIFVVIIIIIFKVTYSHAATSKILVLFF